MPDDTPNIDAALSFHPDWVNKVTLEGGLICFNPFGSDPKCRLTLSEFEELKHAMEERRWIGTENILVGRISRLLSHLCLKASPTESQCHGSGKPLIEWCEVCQAKHLNRILRPHENLDSPALAL